MTPSSRRVVTALALLLGACGGLPHSADPWSYPEHAAELKRPAKGPTLPLPDPVEASRFLQRASFGATEADIQHLTHDGYETWLAEQFRQPQSLVLPTLEAEYQKLEAGKNLRQDLFFQAFWHNAARAPDQLRQRMAFALSEIFVVSLDGPLSGKVRGVASYWDMLARNAFGDFRTLIEEVARHPTMGIYLSHLKNQKEDPKRGRVPDENFARELMQLFTIGLYELNPDGTLRLHDGRPIETYGMDDVTGLAKVFTGFSYGGPGQDDRHFHRREEEARWDILPMKGYPKFHSTSEKRFLTVVIPPQSTPDPDGDLKIALDRLFRHPNLGPFFGRQLIQRLVTSNPSPAYVARVARAFDDNGAGVRGDMQAVIRAVLLDPEARRGKGEGKLREPVLRLAQWMRAFDARSESGQFLIGNTDDPGTSLGQTPMRATSVFNFYRPGFMPPGGAIAGHDMVAPEMQIVSESSVAGYANFIQATINNGVGRTSGGRRDVQADYSALAREADTPAALVARLDLLLTGSRLTPQSRNRIEEAIAAVRLPSGDGPAAGKARSDRVKLATLLVMVSPEYLVER